MFDLSGKYVGSFAELTTMDNRLLTSGKVLLVGEDMIEVSNGFRSAAIRAIDDCVKLSIKSNRLPPIFLKGTIYLPTFDNFRLVNIEVLSEKDNRNFFRLAVHDEIYITTEKNQVTSSIMLDISLGGALIQSSAHLIVGDQINVTIPYKNANFEIQSTVLRVLPHTESLTNYGVSFSGITPKQSDMLCEYLFARQKEEINRLKNNN